MKEVVLTKTKQMSGLNHNSLSGSRSNKVPCRKSKRLLFKNTRKTNAGQKREIFIYSPYIFSLMHILICGLYIDF